MPAGGAAAGGGELAVAALAALSAWEEGSGFDERSRESGGLSFGVGGSCGSDAFATSSGATMSTAIGSAVTELKGWTSAKKITSNRHDKCASADAVMPDFRI